MLDDAETTVAGAAMFGWYGVGEFSSPEQARAQVNYQYRYFWPQTEPEIIEEYEMLKTISPLISPTLLKVLAEMGHGDEIIFPTLTFRA